MREKQSVRQTEAVSVCVRWPCKVSCTTACTTPDQILDLKWTVQGPVSQVPVNLNFGFVWPLDKKTKAAFSIRCIREFREIISELLLRGMFCLYSHFIHMYNSSVACLIYCIWLISHKTYEISKEAVTVLLVTAAFYMDIVLNSTHNLNVKKFCIFSVLSHAKSAIITGNETRYLDSLLSNQCIGSV